MYVYIFVCVYHRCESHVTAVDACQTKIGEFDVPSARDQDVLGLQIPVKNIMRVKELQTTQQLTHHILNTQVQWCKCSSVLIRN